MKNKKFDAVKMKRQLQKEAELKLANLSEKEQFELFHKKFGYLMRDFLFSSGLLNFNEPQMNTDEHRFRIQYPCLSVFICG
jgi:hypothetical protein